MAPGGQPVSGSFRSLAIARQAAPMARGAEVTVIVWSSSSLALAWVRATKTRRKDHAVVAARPIARRVRPLLRQSTGTGRPQAGGQKL